MKGQCVLGKAGGMWDNLLLDGGHAPQLRLKDGAMPAPLPPRSGATEPA